MPTRKRQQLDINLANVKDAGVRAALSTLVEHVNKLTQDVIVSGEMQAETLRNHNEKFRVLKSGKLECDAIQVNGGGSFKVSVSSGSIASMSDAVLTTPANTQIVGVFGFTSRAGITTIWRPIAFDYMSGVGIQFVSTSSAGSSNSVRLTSDDPTLTNYYRVVIFYVESGTT